MINVTKTYLPSLEEYNRYLKRIWESGWITNNGALVQELERQLREFFGVKHVFLVANGTLALQIAVRALDIEGEILTTPFSYVASTSSFVWEGCRPKFIDIDPDTLCLDPSLIEKAITPETSAILAVHVYGNPCRTREIEAIARRRKLKVIYDAAHAFGVEYNGRSIMNEGDISTLSLHATKIFHTAEGGAVITNNDAIGDRIAAMRNFGQTGQDQFGEIGINAKISELHAAMGLCLLPKVPDFIRRRKLLSELYTSLFKGSRLRMPKIEPGTVFNYAYYPVIFPTETMLLETAAHLRGHRIFPRRYFYPSLNTLNYVPASKLPVAEDIAARVLCLPLYYELEEEQIREIAGRALELVNRKG